VSTGGVGRKELEPSREPIRERSPEFGRTLERRLVEPGVAVEFVSWFPFVSVRLSLSSLPLSLPVPFPSPSRSDRPEFRGRGNMFGENEVGDLSRYSIGLASSCAHMLCVCNWYPENGDTFFKSTRLACVDVISSPDVSIQ